MHGGIEETDGLGQLVGDFEEGVGGGGFDEGGGMHRGEKVERVEIDGCLFCGFGIVKGGDPGSLPRYPSLLSLSSR